MRGKEAENPEYQKKLVADLDSDLYAWLDSVPLHLKWDPERTDPIFFQQSAVLYANYYFVQVRADFVVEKRRPEDMILTELIRHLCTDFDPPTVYSDRSYSSQRGSFGSPVPGHLHERRSRVCSDRQRVLPKESHSTSVVHARIHGGDRSADRGLGRKQVGVRGRRQDIDIRGREKLS